MTPLEFSPGCAKTAKDFTKRFYDIPLRSFWRKKSVVPPGGTCHRQFICDVIKQNKSEVGSNNNNILCVGVGGGPSSVCLVTS